MAKRTKKLIDHIVVEDSIRLNKYLSDAGLCSRREADQYIASGEVTVDGVTAVTGTKVVPGQNIVFRGKSIEPDEKLILIAFNKPRGIVCTTDRREKDNIIDYINYGKRIYPIGRLDKDSEGIILLTNDGNIVNKILRAGNNHEKEYIVELNKPITSEFLKGMAEGVPILDTVTLPCKIQALSRTTFQIILTQGLNRQIRRMCEYYGYKVLTLKRVRIMNINLGYLQLGGYRNVTDKEIGGLNELLSDSVNTPMLIDLNRTISENNAQMIETTEPREMSETRGKTEPRGKTESRGKIETKGKTETTGKTESNIKIKSTYKKGSNTKTNSNFKTGSKTGTKSNYRTGNNIDSKSDFRSRNNTELKSDYNSGKNPELKSDFKTGRNPETKSDYKTRNNTESKRDFKTGRNPETKSNFKTGRNPETKSDYRSRNNTGLKSDYKSGRNPETKSNFKTRRNPETKSDYRSRNNTELKSDYKSGRNLESKSNFKTARNPETKSDFKTGRNSEIRRDFKTGRNPESKSNFETGRNPETKSDFKTGRSPETKSNFKTRSSAETKSFSAGSHTRMNDKKPITNGRDYGRKTNTNQRAGRKTK
jgi:23S rRNA pseudouridine2604 synthase